MPVLEGCAHFLLTNNQDVTICKVRRVRHREKGGHITFGNHLEDVPALCKTEGWLRRADARVSICLRSRHDRLTGVWCQSASADQVCARYARGGVEDGASVELTLG